MADGFTQKEKSTSLVKYGYIELVSVWVIKIEKLSDCFFFFYIAYINVLFFQEILDARQQRVQRREELASRRSHASLERMRILSQLAYDPNGMSSRSPVIFISVLPLFRIFQLFFDQLEFCQAMKLLKCHFKLVRN